MKADFFIIRLLSGIVALLLFGTVEASVPLWIFTPLTATTITVLSDNTATVQYRLTNQSSRSHTLAMNNITGVTQITTGADVCGNPFTLSGKSSCILTLQVSGEQAITGNTNGPVVCEQGSQLQCYQPSPSDILNITVTVTPIIYAYVANFRHGGDTVSQCTANDTKGALENCGLTGNGFSRPAGVAFNTG